VDPGFPSENANNEQKVDRSLRGGEDIHMPSIFDRAVEASFKPAEGGYDFRCPSPWLIGSWRFYRVNEAQKERLSECLRQRQRLVLRLLAGCLLIAAAFTALQSRADSDPAIAGAFVIVILAVLLMIAVVQHVYLMRKIEPVLAEVRRPGEHAGMHDQIVGVAASISPLPLVLGGVGGALIAAANIKSMILAAAEGRVGLDIIWSFLGLLVGAGLTGYFGYLAILKRRLRQRR
jgi:hypothetical protein